MRRLIFKVEMLEKKIKAMFRITSENHIVVKNNSALLLAKFHKAVSLTCEDNLRSPYSGGVNSVY